MKKDIYRYNIKIGTRFYNVIATNILNAISLAEKEWKNSLDETDEKRKDNFLEFIHSVKRKEFIDKIEPGA